MKLYDAFGPNPRALRMFLAEKGIDLPDRTEIDIMSGQNRAAAYTERNPGGQVPALELDNGLFLAETVAIMEYLEDKNPTPALIGGTPEDKAETRMWQRRIELGITENLYNGFRFAEGLDLFKDRMRTLPEAADGLKAIKNDKLAWLDGLMNGKEWIVGDRLTVADIILYAALDFGASVGQAVDPSLKNVNGWFARVGERPSAAGSLHPSAATVGFKG